MRRSLITWSVVFGLLLTAFAVTVLALNSTVYSAGGFVRGYLDALSRKDTVAALETPGVEVDPNRDARLLTSEAMGDLDDYRVVSDEAGEAGEHTVVVEYTLGDEQYSTAFLVAAGPPRFGFFSSWSFATSPVADVVITVLHDQDFEVNGHDLVSAAPPNEGGSYLAFAPGLYELGHTSAFLTARPVALAVTDPDARPTVVVDVQANAEFAEQLQTELSGFLDDCATQTVLLPTSCPFGREVANRIVSEPAWSIVDYPTATIVPGISAGTWAMPPTEGTAHLTVDVRSLFDGTVATVDEDVVFTVEYLIEFRAGNTLVITAVPSD